MKETTAKRLADMLLRHGGEQNDCLAAIQADESPEEFLRIRAMIGQTMGARWTEALQPIFAEYPALKPKGSTEAAASLLPPAREKDRVPPSGKTPSFTAKQGEGRGWR